MTSQPFTAFRMVTTATGLWTMGTVQGNNDLFQLAEIEFFGSAAPAAPAVNLSVSAATGTEAGTTAITVTATAASAVTGAQTVSLAVTGAGIAASDYALSSSTMTIPNGATTGTVTFAGTGGVPEKDVAILTVEGGAPVLVEMMRPEFIAG